MSRCIAENPPLALLALISQPWPVWQIFMRSSNFCKLKLLLLSLLSSLQQRRRSGRGGLEEDEVEVGGELLMAPPSRQNSRRGLEEKSTKTTEKLMKYCIELFSFLIFSYRPIPGPRGFLEAAPVEGGHRCSWNDFFSHSIFGLSRPLNCQCKLFSLCLRHFLSRDRVSNILSFLALVAAVAAVVVLADGFAVAVGEVSFDWSTTHWKQRSAFSNGRGIFGHWKRTRRKMGSNFGLACEIDFFSCFSLRVHADTDDLNETALDDRAVLAQSALWLLLWLLRSLSVCSMIALCPETPTVDRRAKRRWKKHKEMKKTEVEKSSGWMTIFFQSCSFIMGGKIGLLPERTAIWTQWVNSVLHIIWSTMEN